jgi:hypothetical protein
MNYPFKEFAKVGILRQTGKAKCKKMTKTYRICSKYTGESLFFLQNYYKRVKVMGLPVTGCRLPVTGNRVPGHRLG